MAEKPEKINIISVGKIAPVKKKRAGFVHVEHECGRSVKAFFL